MTIERSRGSAQLVGDSPVAHALGLLASGETDAALRWSAAALESDTASPAALVVTAHALRRLGHERAAIDAFTAAVRRVETASDAPLAIAAICELRATGVRIDRLIDEVAEVVCTRPETDGPAWRGSLQPVSPLLTPHALVARATQLVYEAAGAEHPRSTTTTFLGALSPSSFRELVLACDAMIVPSGYVAVEEGRASLDLYIVASGEVEIWRRAGRSPGRSLARLESGALFGEATLLASLPAASTAVTARPSILLRASRAAVEAAGTRDTSFRLELGAHCRRQAVGNLGSACAFMATVPLRERGALVDRMTSRVYAHGERLVHAGEDATGLHLILSGEVALVGREGRERLALSTLAAGDVVGEAELVFVRNADAEAIAVCPTVALFLPRDEFFALALDYPAILHGVYSAAVRRTGETGQALASGTAAVLDAEIQLDEAPTFARPSEKSSPSERAALPSAPPPLTSAAHGADATPPSQETELRPAPSLAPVAASSHPPPRSTSLTRGALFRRSAQGAGVVAVAASVAAVLAMRGERPSGRSFHENASAAAPAAPSPPLSAPLVVPAATRSASAVVEKPVLPPTTPALPMRTFLTSALKRRRPGSAPPASAAPAVSVVPVIDGAPSPGAAAIATAPAPAPAPEPVGESEFGGRE